jgi:hypothetical protein
LPVILPAFETDARELKLLQRENDERMWWWREPWTPNALLLQAFRWTNRLPQMLEQTEIHLLTVFLWQEAT